MNAIIIIDFSYQSLNNNTIGFVITMVLCAKYKLCNYGVQGNYMIMISSTK